MATLLCWLCNNPLKFVGLCVIGSLPIIDIYLKRKARKEFQVPVYNKLVRGSRPLLLISDNDVIPREKCLLNLQMTGLLTLVLLSALQVVENPCCEAFVQQVPEGSIIL